jgi:hypothetical protein
VIKINRYTINENTKGCPNGSSSVNITRIAEVEKVLELRYLNKIKIIKGTNVNSI